MWGKKKKKPSNNKNDYCDQDHANHVPLSFSIVLI